MTPIQFVSLGPGDPELVTMKGCRALCEADVLMLPATLRDDGSLSSRASDIVKHIQKEYSSLFTMPPSLCTNESKQDAGISMKHEALYPLPMEKDRGAVQRVYRQMGDDACRWQAEGKRVVIGVEGDISIYASIHYLFRELKERGVAVEQVAGIPSFIAAASAACLSIVSGKERMTVVPGTFSEDAARDWLADGGVVVVMKLSLCETAIRRFVSEHTEYEYYYFENVSIPRQVVRSSTKGDTLLPATSPLPYFSLLMIK